ncbi:MAG TPA: ABC transporter permease, partial [Solirubrobacteraceae bacterium]|nr:ABC transporter permease [Solirubrobacteraceae bacterium]
VMSAPPAGLVTRRLLRPRTLIYFYRRRLRAHGMQELFAGIGIAAAVALVLAAGVAQSSVAGSTRKVVRAVVGPANLQLRTRGPRGFPEALLAEVEQIPGVRRAAPLLERSIHVIGSSGKSTTVYLAGTDTSLGVLNGLGRTLPLSALMRGTVSLSNTSAKAIGLGVAAPHQRVTLLLGGRRETIRVGAVLGKEAIGVLATAPVAVMELSSMQRLLAAPGLVSRILVEAVPAAKPEVERKLRALSGGRLIVSGAEQDVTILEKALGPSGQASALFAVIGALLGFLFAFNAILLTIPERRQAIADLRLAGTTRSAIIQLTSFQALCLGLVSSIVGLLAGYVLSRWVFHQSTGYLAEAFTLSGGTVFSVGSVLAAGLGGVVVTWLASALPLLDLRRGRSPDAIYMHAGEPGNTLGSREQRVLLAVAVALLAAASVIYGLAPSAALIASVALALATVLSIPAAFAAVLASAHRLSERAQRLPTLALALAGVRATTLRSLALAATGAVALFGSVALGGARANLLSGIRDFAHSYAADAQIWVGEPGDNQATVQLAGDGGASRIAHLPGVASVRAYQGAFLTFGSRRVWVIARPPGGANHVLTTQALGGASGLRAAEQRLAEGGWIAVSRQIAEEHHVGVGSILTVPTPSGPRAYRIAALTTNLAWSPGVVFMGASDFARAWETGAPSALAVRTTTNASVKSVEHEIAAALGRASGLEVASAAVRKQKIDRLTSEGLSQLGLVSTLLLLAAILALAAALTSSIHQRRRALAGLRLAGAPPGRLRRVLLLEALLVLAAGCVTGALAGVYGQFVIDAYLRHVTGFPVTGAGEALRPIEIFVLVLGAALALAALPGWRASNVPPALALADE